MKCQRWPNERGKLPQSGGSDARGTGGFRGTDLELITGPQGARPVSTVPRPIRLRGSDMSKGMDRKKETKKKPAKTPEEKRAEKRAKKGK